MGGDFNARMGMSGRLITEKGDEKGGRRCSKNKKENKEGRKLVKYVEERGWSMFNRDIKGDEEGEFTFTGGKGCTVIDYVIGDREVRNRVRELKWG